MKAYLIHMHLLLPSSRSSAKIKVKYNGYISQKMAASGAFVFHKHILLKLVIVWYGAKHFLNDLLTSKAVIDHRLSVAEMVDMFFDSLPKDRILDITKLKAFADDK